MPIQYPSQYIF